MVNQAICFPSTHKCSPSHLHCIHQCIICHYDIHPSGESNLLQSVISHLDFSTFITFIWMVNLALPISVISHLDSSLLCPISPEQPAAVCPFINFSCYLKETSEDTSIWLGLSPLDLHTQQVVDAMELFHRFCYWTLIWLSRYWAWLCRGYLLYRNLIGWLIDSIFITFVWMVISALPHHLSLI